jgi:tight adherence protein C
MAVIFALYTATTVRDPMAGRVKALNDRREQLKAGIVVSSGKRRAKLTQKNETTDRMRSFLSSLRVLQDTQLKAAQGKLVQAGIRSKDAAVAVIFGRMFLPIVIGGGVAIAVYGFGWKADWSAMKKFFLIAGALIGSYKAPDIFVANKIKKRSDAIRKGLPDALDLLVICAEAGQGLSRTWR